MQQIIGFVMTSGLGYCLQSQQGTTLTSSGRIPEGPCTPGLKTLAQNRHHIVLEDGTHT